MRKLRFALEHSGKRIILFTSTKPQEGKTVIIESVAHTFSMNKKKILIIDSNFANNTLTRDFSAKPSLVSFSMNGEDSVDKVWDITTVTNIPNVDIIGCDEGNYSPSEILPKNNLMEHLGKLKHQYDFILIEGAALNIHADSKELLEFVDGVVAVFSAKSTLQETDRDSIVYLKHNRHKFIGAVLNNFDEQNLGL